MEPLTLLAWFIVGTIAAGFLVTFWEEIRTWLNTVAADFVEKHLGYSARQKMHRAIAVVDSVVDKIRNTTTIFCKRNQYDTYFDKTTIVTTCNNYEISRDVLEEITKQQRLTQTFEYKR